MCMVVLGGSNIVFAGTGYHSTLTGFPQVAIGGSGAYVKCVQRIMFDYSYYTRCLIHGSGGVDGSFGDATFNAVVYYQTQKGITSNGWVGPQTWGKIDDDMSYDSTVYFSSDGYFDMYKGTGLYYKNYVVRRGAVSGVWSVRTSHPTGASYATNGTCQVFHS